MYGARPRGIMGLRAATPPSARWVLNYDHQFNTNILKVSNRKWES